jgi:hypothetical protein
VVKVGRGDSLVLPSLEDQQSGLVLAAEEPVGRELVFAIVSPRDLPSLPVAEGGGLLSTFPAGGPARTFTNWLEKLRGEHRNEMEMAVLDFEIGAAR